MHRKTYTINFLIVFLSPEYATVSYKKTVIIKYYKKYITNLVNEKILNMDDQLILNKFVVWIKYGYYYK